MTKENQMLTVFHRLGCRHHSKLLGDGPTGRKVAQQLSAGSGEQLLISSTGTRVEEAGKAHLLTVKRHGDGTQGGRHLPPQCALSTKAKRDGKIKAHSGESAKSPSELRGDLLGVWRDGVSNDLTDEAHIVLLAKPEDIVGLLLGGIFRAVDRDIEINTSVAECLYESCGILGDRRRESRIHLGDRVVGIGRHPRKSERTQAQRRLLARMDVGYRQKLIAMSRSLERVVRLREFTK